MPRKFNTTPASVQELMGDIEARKLALPDFQRSFVWEPGATSKLLSSLIQDFPAGSLLTWNPGDQEMEIREFEGAPKVSRQSSENPRLVLDGQQRLTSLY